MKDFVLRDYHGDCTGDFLLLTFSCIAAPIPASFGAAKTKVGETSAATRKVAGKRRGYMPGDEIEVASLVKGGDWVRFVRNGFSDERAARTENPTSDAVNSL
jgi:hypothetical protein